MTYLMTHQQVVDAVRSVPDRQGEDTSVHVERCSGDLTVLNHKVLGGKQAGEVTFDFCGVHRVSCVDAYSIYKKRVPEGTPRPLLQLSP